jgi:hypothetical protein
MFVFDMYINSVCGDRLSLKEENLNEEELTGRDSQPSCSTSILDLDVGSHDLTFLTPYTVPNPRPTHTTYANTATPIPNLALDTHPETSYFPLKKLL